MARRKKSSDADLVPGSIWKARKESRWAGERFEFVGIDRGWWVGKSLTDGGEIKVELAIARDLMEPEKR